VTFPDGLLLGVIVALVAYGLGYVLVARRSPDPAMGIGLALLPYWTLAGAIPILLTKRTDPTRKYSYLEDRLFRIFPDGTYAVVLLAYVIFLFGSLTLIAFWARPETPERRAASGKQWTALSMRFSHGLLLFGVGAMVLVKFGLALYLIRSSTTGSLYETTRIVKGGNAPILRIYQYLNFVSSYPLAAGFVLWLAFPAARATRLPFRRGLVWAVYLVLLLGSIAENALLGNRAVPLVVMAAIAAGWIRWKYLPATRAQRRPLRRHFLLVSFAGLLVLGTIGLSRGGSLDSPAAVTKSLEQNFVQVGNVVVQTTRSSEKLAAHMSLYGIVERRDQIPDKPLLANSYKEYARVFNAPEDQVFTIHYVAAWWLRLGPLGLIPAVLTFALAVALVQRLATRAVSAGGAAFSLTAATLPAAGIPIIVVRSGPESLRAVFIELVLLPALVLLPCFLLGRRRDLI
jgi:hypothetical protein